MRKEDLTNELVRIYDREVDGIQNFLIKPWEIKVNDVVTLRPLGDILTLSRMGLLYAPCRLERHEISQAVDLKVIITKEILSKIHKHRSVLFTYKNNDITLAMLQLDEKECMEEIDLPIYSITQRTKEREILDEMISKVDRKRLQQLLSISASSYENKHFVKDSVVDNYLELWARAKYEFYLLFGRNLTIQKEVEEEITSADMKDLILELRMRFPKYALWLDKFETSEYITNQICYVQSSIRELVPFATNGMKLSNFFNKLLEDEKFNIELSKIMQNKKVKGNIVVSIDPYDYLTSSINRHFWKSCHRITDGEYGTGSLSYMLDRTTMIAYKHNGKDYDYNFYNFKFTGNSKTFRQCIYFDKDSCNIIFGRNYPNTNDIVANHVEGLLKEKVCEYHKLPVDSLWTREKKWYEGNYEDMSCLHYSDVENDWGYIFTRLLQSKSEVANFAVGYDVPCLICGDDVTEEGECGLCYDCRCDDEYDDEDDDY